jgi:hypothetical protein
MRTGWYSEGAITGWSFREPVPVINKIMAANRAVVTPIPSIFQAGQWTYSPAGVPMSILTGKLAARRILNMTVATEVKSYKMRKEYCTIKNSDSNKGCLMVLRMF